MCSYLLDIPGIASGVESDWLHYRRNSRYPSNRLAELNDQVSGAGSRWRWYLRIGGMVSDGRAAGQLRVVRASRLKREFRRSRRNSSTD